MGVQTWRYLEPYKKDAIVTTRGLEGMYWICRLLTPLRLSSRSAVLCREPETQTTFCIWPYFGEGYPLVPDESRVLTQYRAAALLQQPSGANAFHFMGLLNTDISPPVEIEQGCTLPIDIINISASYENVIIS